MVTKEEILEELKSVEDPEIGMDIVNLGLVYEVNVNADKVFIRMTMTAPTCPVTPWILAEVQKVVENMAGVEMADVELVWEPPWNPKLMSEEARESLNM